MGDFPLGFEIDYVKYMAWYSSERHTYVVNGLRLTVTIQVPHSKSESSSVAAAVCRPLTDREIAAERVQLLCAAVEAACRSLWGAGTLRAANSTGVISAWHAESLEWK